MKKPSRKTLDNKLWKLFSEYIRRRDSNSDGYGKCCTCGLIKFWKDADAGHFMSRRYLSTKFDERNVHLQCKGCNGPGSGRQYEMGQYIDTKLGEGTADDLLLLSKRQSKWTTYDYEIKILEYKEKLLNL